MELFHEVKNAIFLKLLEISNKLAEGQEYSYQQILQEIKNAFPNIEADYSLEENLINEMFNTNENEVKLHINKPVPFLPSQVELFWLKTFLKSPINQALLSQELYKKLNEALLAVPESDLDNVWQKETYLGDDQENKQLLQNLNIIQAALINQKKISYTNTTLDGTIYDAIASPHRIEYSLKENKYRLIIWNEVENRAIKMNIANISNIKIQPTPIPPNEHIALEGFFNDQLASTTPLLLKLTPKNNAFERAFSLFANYDKTAYCENNDYILKINYHRFEEQEIIQNLLSLGSAITVIEPIAIRTKIFDIYQQSYQQLCD